MRRYSALILAVLLILSNEALSRRGGSSSFSSRRSSSSSWSSKRTSTTKKSTPAKRKSSNSFTKTKTKTSTKTKAVSKTRTSRKLQKKNALAAKKYGSKSNAQKAFRNKLKNDPKLAKSHPIKFNKKPDVRPSYIPGSVSRGGTTYNVTYYNGGYGYYSMVDGMRTWMLLDMATDIMITDAMLRNHGYGTYTATGAPITRTPVSAGVIVLSVVGGVVGLIIIIAIIKAVLI